uniref:Peter pan homolog n=1 Tax=Sphaeramia orbicularis TaxID=375764 RepID=A0A673C7Q1_9TELE
MGKSKTKNQKKSRATANHVAEETYQSVPHSFVFHRGQIGKNVTQLIMDVRRVMEPFTAESLKVRKKNVLKDFVAIAGPLGVTHFMIFSKTSNSINMRLARLPKGPTLHFRVLKYSLIKDVVSSLKKHRMHDQQFTHHPLLILNNFGSDGMHIKLMATMFQNMFPSINVHKVNLNNIKRCVLLNYNPTSQEIEFRHFLKVVPVGMSRGVKKLMQERFPNMSKLEDISELLMKGTNLSESEAEQDGDHNITELPQVYSGRGNMASQQSAVRLTEIGPRMTLQLTKIQEGMGEGNVLYHAIGKSTLRPTVKLSLYFNRKKSLEGIKRKQAEAEEDSEVEDPGLGAAAVESDDEVEYYRQAVGEEPDEDMFPGAKRKRSRGKPNGPVKKRKLSPGKSSSKDRGGKSPKGDKTGKPQHKKGWKNFGNGEKQFGKKGKPGGKTFGAKKPGDKEKKFGGKKTFGANRSFGGKKTKDKPFRATGQKGKPGLKKGAGAKHSFKQRKGKG